MLGIFVTVVWANRGPSGTAANLASPMPSMGAVGAVGRTGLQPWPVPADAPAKIAIVYGAEPATVPGSYEWTNGL
ncbi:MAG TPA: hypothetical protein VFC19_39755 [Candidatus Limnocylindrales bacterium]|nr:hypothetical protein [Candidatus Limnocylindrales bacterium]